MAKQDDYIKTALRIPRALHAQLMAEAEARGASLNAQFIARLEARHQDPSALIEAIARLNLDLAEADVAIEEMNRENAELSSKLRAAMRLLNRTHFAADLETELLSARYEESTDERIFHSPRADALYEAIGRYARAREELERLKGASKDSK